VGFPNYGVGDTLVRVNNSLKSSNCDLLGFSFPVALVLNGTNSKIVKLKRGESLDVPNVIANSPNLVSTKNGVPYFDIRWDDFGLNRFAHTANSAVGLIGKKNSEGMSQLVFVASDGYDGCPRRDVRCGLESKKMAYFMLDFIKVEEAFELDQGGSSTLYVKGLGVVNSNGEKEERRIFSGIFVK
jgi:hypothetical protein